MLELGVRTKRDTSHLLTPRAMELRKKQSRRPLLPLLPRGRCPPTLAYLLSLLVKSHKHLKEPDTVWHSDYSTPRSRSKCLYAPNEVKVAFSFYQLTFLSLLLYGQLAYISALQLTNQYRYHLQTHCHETDVHLTQSLKGVSDIDSP